MTTNPFSPGDLFSGHHSGSRRRRLITFVTQFNQPGVIACEGDELKRYAEVARRAVKAEILHPETARFGEVFVRRCNDDAIRAAGSVQLDGIEGARFEGWYLVEFLGHDEAEMLDLIDRDPVSLKSIPPEEWEGVLPYARPATAQGRGVASPARRLLWPAIILLCAVLLVFLLS